MHTTQRHNVYASIYIMNYNGIKSALSFACDAAFRAFFAFTDWLHRSFECDYRSKTTCANFLSHTRRIHKGSNLIFYSSVFVVYVILVSLYVINGTDSMVSKMSTARMQSNRCFACVNSLQKLGTPSYTVCNEPNGDKFRIECCSEFDSIRTMEIISFPFCTSQIVGDQFCMDFEWEPFHNVERRIFCKIG